MSMRVCSLFDVLRLFPCDITREHPTRAGIGGLRHKLRHKISRDSQVYRAPIVQGVPHPLLCTHSPAFRKKFKKMPPDQVRPTPVPRLSPFAVLV